MKKYHAARKTDNRFDTRFDTLFLIVASIAFGYFAIALTIEELCK